MGTIELKLNIQDKTITIDWSAVEDEKLYWAARARGYPIQVPNPSFNPELPEDEVNVRLIPNPIPVIAYLLKQGFERISQEAMDRYKNESTELDDAARIATNMAPASITME